LSILIPLATLAYALGIAIADLGRMSTHGVYLLALAILVSGLFAGNRPRLRSVFALLGVGCAGVLAMLAVRGDGASVRMGEPRDMIVQATVCGVDLRANSLSVDLCDCVSADTSGFPIPSKIRLFESLDGASRQVLDRLKHGERIRAWLRLSPVRPPSNPGVNSQFDRYVRLGIGARARLRDPAMLVRIAPNGATLERSEPIARRVDVLRQKIGARLSNWGTGGGLVRALAIGDRAGLPGEARDAFAMLGIGHLLAVSGLHVALVAGLVFAAARRLMLYWHRVAARLDPRDVALVAALVCAVVYAAMSGWGIPVRRAVLFLFVLSASVASGRSVNAVQLLSLAALPILMVEPNALFEMGAQLSFVASAALLLGRSEGPVRSTGVRSLLRTSTTAIVATAPIIAWHGGAAGVYGLVANLVAASMLAALPENPPSQFVIEWTTTVAGLTVDWAIGTAAMLPTLRVSGHAPELYVVGGTAVISILALSLCSTRSRLFLALTQCLLLAAAPAQSIDPGVPRMVVFDVGQGDATLIQGHAATLLVDAGRAIEGAFDMGERVVVPGLVALGVEKLDLVIVSHGDLDHRGGLESVLENMAVGELWLPHGGLALRDFDALLEVAKRRGVLVQERGLGDEAFLAGDLRVQPLWPPQRGGPVGRNEKSLVVRVDIENLSGASTRILLPGDLGAAGEAELLSRGLDIAADVVKVGHHGSAGSSTRNFLASVAPNVAVVSAPCYGRGGLPNRDALKRLEDAGAEIFWTGEVGAVIIGFNTRSKPAQIRGWHPKTECWSH
jgi:competence protein ComEC